MDDQLHAARLVEEALDEQRLLGRQRAQRRPARREMLGHLPGRGLADPRLVGEPPQGLVRAPAEAPVELRAQPRDRARQLVAAARRLAQPEGDRRRQAVGVLDPHRAALHPDDPVGFVAELEDVAAHALDGEILVDRADDLALRLQQDLIIRGVGDGAPAGDRRQPRPAPPAQAAVHRVMVEEGAAPAAPGAEALGQHGDQRVEVRAGQAPIGPGPAESGVEGFLPPILGRGLGDDLLGQHVERLRGNREPVELAALDALQQRRAFHQLVAGQREEAALGQARDGMAGPTDPLEEARDRARGAELADEIDFADVDAELERSGRDQRLQLPALQALLGVEPLLAGEAAVMGGDMGLAQSLGEVAGGPLR